MSVYDDLRPYYTQATPEEKLQIIRTEIVGPVGIIQGFVHLMDTLNTSDAQIPISEFKTLLGTLSQAAIHISDTLDALTYPFDREETYK